MADLKKDAQVVRVELRLLHFLYLAGKALEGDRKTDPPTYTSVRSLGGALSVEHAAANNWNTEIVRDLAGGEKVFDEGARGERLKLSDRGESLYEWAKRVFEAYRDGETRPRRRTVRIGTFQFVMHFVLNKALQDYFKKLGREGDHLGVDLRLKESTLDDIRRDLTLRRIDFGLARAEADPGEDLEREPLTPKGGAGFGWMLVCRKKRKLDDEMFWEQLRGLTVCGIEDHKDLWDKVREPTGRGRKVWVDSQVTIIELAREHVDSVGFVVNFYGRKTPGKDKSLGLWAHPVPHESLPPRQLAVWKRQGEQLGPEAQLVVDCLKEHVTKRLG